MSKFHIYSFTLISGYIYSFLKLENGRYKKAFEFAMGKVKRLIVPFLCAAIWVLPIEILVRQLTAKQVLKQYVLMVRPGQLWFLVMLFGVFMVFYLLTDFFAEHDVAGLLLVLTFYICGTIGNAYTDNYFQIWNICRFVLFFWIGFKIRQKGSASLRKIPASLYLVIDVALFITACILPADNAVQQAFRSGVSMLLYIVGAVMAFVILQSIADRVNWKESKLAGMLIKYSMPVYLIHQQVSYLLTISLNGIISPCFQVIINFVFTLLVSLALSALLYKFKLTRRMLGEKI